MFKKSNIVYIYILLWFLNRLQAVFTTSSVASMLFFIPFILLSLYYVYEAIVECLDSKYIKGLFVFFAVLFVYGVFHLLFGTNYNLGFRVRSNNEFLLGVFQSLTPIFAFYVFSIKGYLKEQTFVKLIIPFVLLATLEYYKAEADLILRHDDSYFEDFTNNVGYTFLSLAPFVFFLYRKTVFQYLFLCYISFFTISSMKRGAIIVMAIFFFWYVIRAFRLVPQKKKLYVYILLLFLLFVGFCFIEYLFLSNEYFQYRVEQTLDGNSSGRNNLYSSILKTFFNEAGIVQLLFGFGADGTIAVAGNLAHSDWLELLFNCGFLGIILYVIYWLRFYKSWMRLKKNQLLYSLIGACFIITFIKSVFSMSYYDMSFYICMSIGYGMGQLYVVKKTLSNRLKPSKQVSL